MDIDLEKYIHEISQEEDELLQELYRKTHTSVINPNMISGHIQGRLLNMLVRMIKPKNILEIGTYTGYSAICMARALSNEGMLHTIEINDELSDFSRDYVEKAGLKDKVVFHTGDALEKMNKLNTIFDLIYIDGDKRQYCEYYRKAMNILNKGGFIIADNVLWAGKVADADQKDSMTEGIRQFNLKVKEDNRAEQVIIPALDGLSLIQKK